MLSDAVARRLTFVEIVWDCFPALLPEDPASVCRRTDPMPMAVGFEPRPLDLHVGSAPEALKRKPLESSITMMYLAGKGSRKKVFEQTLH